MTVERGIAFETCTDTAGMVRLRVRVGGAVSAWRILTGPDLAALAAEQAIGDGACADVEAVYRLARNAWPGPEEIEGT